MAGELQIAAALLLVFFLPGFTLVCVLFPRKEELNPEYGLLYQIALGMVLSLVLVVLLGFVLSSFTDADSGKGYFQAGNLWIALSGLSILFFVLGWWRGAYPFLGKLHPALLRTSPPIDDTLPRDRKVAAEYRRLAVERQRLLKEMRDHELRATQEIGAQREHHLAAKRERLDALAEVDARLQRLREGVVDEDRSESRGQAGAR